MRTSAAAPNTVDDGQSRDRGLSLKAARKARHSIRNYATLLLAFWHGLRVSKLINMRMPDIDLDTGRLFIRRVKGSLPTSQPLEGDEIRALRAWLRQRANAPCCNSPLVFLSERGPMTRQAFNYVCAEVGKRARLSTKVHPHMLRLRAGEQGLAISYRDHEGSRQLAGSIAKQMFRGNAVDGFHYCHNPSNRTAAVRK